MSPAYTEIVDFLATGTTAQEIADFQPTAATKARVADLIAKQKDEGLTTDESDELAAFLHIEHLMRLAKAKARLRLAGGG